MTSFEWKFWKIDLWSTKTAGLWEYVAYRGNSYKKGEISAPTFGQAKLILTSLLRGDKIASI